MATATYTPIATYTASGSQNSISFSSIPNTYTDLVLVLAGNATGGTDYPKIQVNGDSGTNYSDTQLYGTGSSAASYRESNQTSFVFATYPNTSSPTISRFNFMNYSNTTTYKTILARIDYPAGNTNADVVLWRNTSAITSITISETNNFASTSTFTLYGIKAA
jgi:hypothetical protein